MFELVVASGKGGTGKTSIVAALADVIEQTVIVDCDVDAANLHLVVPHRVLEEHDFSCSHRATIDGAHCIACGICLEVCRFNAISMTPDESSLYGVGFSVDPIACEGCGLCKRLCPEQIISFDPVVSGKWFESESGGRPFLHARLGIAQSNSGRLVSLLRQQSRELASKHALDTVVVDGPPGIGCPVIASLTNASYLLIVTEPSLSAIHDMERLVDLAEHFNVKTGICLNKFDINEEVSSQIEEFAAQRGLTLHGRIPYDPVFVEAQLEGRSYMRCASAEGTRLIRTIWQSIQSESGRHASGGKRRFAV
jgi:MinD superfamily P-loop ATPase